MPATIQAVRYRFNIDTLEKESASRLQLNDIGAVVIRTQKPLFCDPYRRNRGTGSFILIDPATNATVAAGMITGREPGRTYQRHDSLGKVADARSRITVADRERRAGHRAVTIWLEGPAALAWDLERRLFDADCSAIAVAAPSAGFALPQIVSALNDAGVIALVYGCADAAARDQARASIDDSRFLSFGMELTSEEIVGRLEESGVLATEPYRTRPARS